MTAVLSIKKVLRLRRSAWTDSLVWSVPAILLLVLSSKSVTLVLAAQGIGWANYLDEILFVGYVAWVGGVTVIGYRRLYFSQVYPWLLVFTLLGALASLVNQVPARIALLGFFLAVKPLLILITFQSLPWERASVGRVLRAIHVLLVVITVAAVVYGLVFDVILVANPAPAHRVLPGSRLDLTPVRSFFVHPGPFSSTMAIAATYHFGRWLVLKSRWSILLCLLALIGVILSIRLKALFIVPWSLLLMYGLNRFRGLRVKRKALVSGAILGVVILIVTLVLAVLLAEVLAIYFSENSSAVRTLLFRNALVINRESWGLGAGFGMYGSAISVSQHYSPLYYRFGLASLHGATPENPTFITDQWWSWFLGEVGLWGTAAFLAALGVTMAGLQRQANFWCDKDPALAALAYAAIGALAYGLLSGFADASLTTPPTGYYIMALAGLGYSLHRGRLRNIQSETRFFPEKTWFLRQRDVSIL